MNNNCIYDSQTPQDPAGEPVHKNHSSKTPAEKPNRSAAGKRVIKILRYAYDFQK